MMFFLNFFEVDMFLWILMRRVSAGVASEAEIWEFLKFFRADYIRIIYYGI